MFQNIKISPLPVVLLIQTIIIIIVYLPFFTNGEAILFNNSFDGLKNYFTYYTYLFQGNEVPNTMYNQMNYPFYEYIFYTDQTPVFSVPLKWISDNIVDITPYAFRIFNWFCLFGILLSTLFNSLIINKITKQNWLWSILAITLPWITPQIFRLGVGHFNLAFSWCIVGTFYLMIRLYDIRKDWKKVGWFSLGLLLWIYVVSFIHLYYLPMLCLIIGMFGVVIGIWNRKNKKTLWSWVAWSGGLPILGLLSVWGTIRLIDTYYVLRKKTEDSYNWSEWNFKIDGFYTNYEFSTIPFPIEASFTLSGESYAYLGTCALYGLLFLFGWLIFRTIQKRSHFKNTFKTYFSGENGAIALLILFAGIMVLNVSIGEYAKMFNNKLSFDNPFHPFKYVRLFAGEVTQFRVLARFNWVCFWAFNFVAIYLLDTFFERHQQRWLRGIILVFALSSIVNMLDMHTAIKQAKVKNPLLEKNIVEPIDKILEGIDTDKYQAILPIPFYLIGSEDYDMMLNAKDAWRTRTFVLSFRTDLPLMASSLSRSGVEQHRALLSIFTEKGMNDYLKTRLNDQPILVFISNNDYAWQVEHESEQSKAYMMHGKKVVDQYNMKLLKTQGIWELYEWNLN